MVATDCPLCNMLNTCSKEVGGRLFHADKSRGYPPTPLTLPAGSFASRIPGKASQSAISNDCDDSNQQRLRRFSVYIIGRSARLNHIASTVYAALDLIICLIIKRVLLTSSAALDLIVCLISKRVLLTSSSCKYNMFIFIHHTTI